MTSSMLQTQALFALQQQLISHILESGDKSSLADSLLKRGQKSGRQISAEALTGRIRSDAGMLRQAATNASEGAAIAKMANTATTSMLTSLQSMYELALEVVNAGSSDPGTESAYTALANGVKNTINTTAYNGINLMTKDKWGSDERLNVAADEKSASLSIQAGTSARPLNLMDFSGIISGVDNGAVALADAQGTADKLSEIINTVKMQDKSYSSLASSFEADAKGIERQSKILDISAARNIAGTSTDPVTRLLYLLLSDQGRIINSSL